MGLEDKLQGGEKGNGLEKRVSFGSALKKFSWWDWTKIIGFNAAAAAVSGGLLGYGALNVVATTASFVTANYLVNRKKGFTKKSLQTELVLGAPYTASIYKLFDLINVFTPNPLLWMGAYAASLYPFTVATHAMKYTIDKYSPSTFLTRGILKGGFINDVKHIANDAVTDSIKSSAKAALWLTLPVAASHYLLPEQYLIASLYPIRTAYRYILETQEQRKTAQPTFMPSYFSRPIMQAA